jgi:hypothetical protein
MNTVGAIAHTAGVADGWLHVYVGIADGGGVYVPALDGSPRDGRGVYVPALDGAPRDGRLVKVPAPDDTRVGVGSLEAGADGATRVACADADGPRDPEKLGVVVGADECDGLGEGGCCSPPPPPCWLPSMSVIWHAARSA